MKRERYIPDFVFDNLDNLKQDALSKGYTMKSLAVSIGMEPRNLSHFKNGNYMPSPATYNKIAVALGWEVWQ